MIASVVQMKSGTSFTFELPMYALGESLQDTIMNTGGHGICRILVLGKQNGEPDWVLRPSLDVDWIPSVIMHASNMRS